MKTSRLIRILKQHLVAEGDREVVIRLDLGNQVDLDLLAGEGLWVGVGEGVTAKRDVLVLEAGEEVQ